MAQIRVLLVEDDTLSRELMALYLKGEGMIVSEADSLAALRQSLRQAAPDIVVLDLMLGDGNGLDAMREIAEAGCGVIVLSSRDSPVDRILGLELGAHDYLAKPLEPRELALRIRKLYALLASAGEQPAQELFRFGPFELDPSAHQLRRSVDGSIVTMTGTQFRLLELLVRHPNRVFERDTLVDQIFGRRWVGLSRSIDVLVSKTRAHIDEAVDTTWIKSIRGVGYVFVGDVKRVRRKADEPASGER
jgi:DNA-binding response OmpR family regulator